LKATDNFFAKKRAWSQLKDEILACYLTPYLAKLIRTRKQIIIADCFAGKGRFDDGQDGSPIIIASAIADALGHPREGRVSNIRSVLNRIVGTPYRVASQILSLSRTWNHFVMDDRSGQRALFESFDYPDMSGLYDYDIRNDILNFTEKKILLKDLMVHLIEKYGIAFSESCLKKRDSHNGKE